MGGSLVGGLGATTGTGWVDRRAEQREREATARVIYREVVHNGQALATFRQTEGHWLDEPNGTAWPTYGIARPRILDKDDWAAVASGYSLTGYWPDLSHEDDTRTS